MRKILMLVLATFALPSCSQERAVPAVTWEEEDYGTLATALWGTRDGGWKISSGLKDTINMAEKEAKTCSKKMKYVPLPLGAPPQLTVLAKYAISLRSRDRNIKQGESFVLCIKVAARAWKTPAEDSQYN